MENVLIIWLFLDKECVKCHKNICCFAHLSGYVLECRMAPNIYIIKLDIAIDIVPDEPKA